MKKKTSKNSDLILNMLPASSRTAKPTKAKKAPLTTMGAAANDSERSRAAWGRSFAMGTLQASQYAQPLSDGVIMSFTAEDSVHINASKTGEPKGHDVKGGLKVEAANTAQLMPFFHTPGNAQDAYNLPKTYVEQVRWSRLMYNLNPYIGAITDLKAFYALSKFKLVTPEPAVTEFYSQVAFNKDFNLYEFIRRMSLNIQKFGEAVVL